MGLFDIFTGESAKKAAAENKALLQANQAEGTATLRGGETNSLASLDKAGGFYAPLSAKYGMGTNTYLDSLGINGAEGNARATDAFKAGPGYDWRVSQALDQTNRAAAATGGLAGGNTLAALSDRAGNMASQEYGGWQDRLAGLISPEFQAVGGQAGMEAGKVPVYQSTANSIASLGTNTATGIANQNTQAANAAMQGSGNLWGLGLNLAKLGVGAATGGTSLLGGGGGAGIGSLFMGGGSPSGY
jgi:hypothetical protein